MTTVIAHKTHKLGIAWIKFTYRSLCNVLNLCTILISRSLCNVLISYAVFLNLNVYVFIFLNLLFKMFEFKEKKVGHHCSTWVMSDHRKEKTDVSAAYVCSLKGVEGQRCMGW